MSNYRLHFTTTASSSIEVEADDLESAIEEASQKAPTICAQCSGWGRDYSLDMGDEWDFDDSGYTVDGEYVEGES